MINIGSAILFVPYYIDYLGIEAYGIINFYTVLLSILFFADAGLSGTLNREIALDITTSYKRNLVHSIEIFFLIISVLIFFGIGVSSNLIAENFLKTDTYLKKELAHYVIIMGGSISLQLFTSIENSGLLGLEKQFEANIIQSSGGILKSAGVLVPLYFYPTITTFFIWQLSINILIFFVTRYNLWSHLKSEVKPKLDLKILKNLSGFMSGLFGLAILSAINTQLDKITVTKLLSLKEFAFYSIGSLVAQAPLMIITPITIAFLPKIVKRTDKSEKLDLQELYRFESYIVSGLASLVAVVLIVFLEELLVLWLSDTEIINEVLKFGKILIIANLLLALQITPYHLGIAHGHTKTSLRISFYLLFLLIPIMIWATSTFGLVGASATWLGYNFIALTTLTYKINKLFVAEQNLNYWILYVLIPIIINAVIGCLFLYLKTFFSFSTLFSSTLILFQILVSFLTLGLIATRKFSKLEIQSIK